MIARAGPDIIAIAAGEHPVDLRRHDAHSPAAEALRPARPRGRLAQRRFVQATPAMGGTSIAMATGSAASDREGYRRSGSRQRVAVRLN